MARSLNFTLNGSEIAASIEKVDRRKLYGWVEKKALDRDGQECYFGSISDDGMHIFGRQSFEQGYTGADGSWLEKGALTVVDNDGAPRERRESSFKQTIALGDQVSVDNYLDHIAKSIYQLDADSALIDAVRAADGVYAFPFNYTASFSPDTAFLVENEGTLFMIIGEPTGFEFIGLAEADTTVLVEDEDDDDDGMDFSMF